MKSQTMIPQTHSGQTVKPQTHLGHIHQTLSEALSNIPDTFKMIQRHSGPCIKPRHICFFTDSTAINGNGDFGLRLVYIQVTLMTSICTYPGHNAS